MLGKNELENLWVTLALGVGTAVLVTLIATPVGAMPTWRVVLLYFLGAASFTAAAVGLEWIRKSWVIRYVVGSTLMVAVIWGGLGAIAWQILPVEPYCYFLPYTQATNQSDTTLRLYGHNPTQQPLEDTVVDCLLVADEGKPPNDKLTRRIGHVRADQYLANPPIFVPANKDRENSYSIVIWTRDAIFVEFLRVKWADQNWKVEYWDLVDITSKRERKLASSRTTREPGPPH